MAMEPEGASGKKMPRLLSDHFCPWNCLPADSAIRRAPDAAHAIAERLKEQAEDDDEGGPESPARHLDRQLRRIRRGERLEALRTLLPDRD